MMATTISQKCEPPSSQKKCRKERKEQIGLSLREDKRAVGSILVCSSSLFSVLVFCQGALTNYYLQQNYNQSHISGGAVWKLFCLVVAGTIIVMSGRI